MLHHILVYCSACMPSSSLVMVNPQVLVHVSCQWSSHEHSIPSPYLTTLFSPCVSSFHSSCSLKVVCMHVETSLPNFFTAINDSFSKIPHYLVHTKTCNETLHIYWTRYTSANKLILKPYTTKALRTVRKTSFS